MKQTTNKKFLFRGCPNEEGKKNISNCRECSNFERCLKKKEMRIRKRRIQNLSRFIIIFGIVCISFLCMFTIYSAIIKGNEEYNDYSKKGDITSSGENLNLDAITIEPKVSIIVMPSATPSSTPSTTPSSITNDTPTTESNANTFSKAELSADGPGDTYYYDISYEDKVLIAKTVWAEARGECFEGKVAVAAVILNRYCSGKSYFGIESIENVVTKPHQFANIENVTMEDLEKNPQCMEAVEAACKGWDPTRAMFEEGALYFYAPKGIKGAEAEKREGICVLVIGNHNFHYDFNKVS